MSPQTAKEDDAGHPATVSEKIQDSIQGKDEPMEDTHPEAPPFLVFASYPLVLIVGIILVALAFWLTRS